jgi:hypothetical protein
VSVVCAAREQDFCPRFIKDHRATAKPQLALPAKARAVQNLGFHYLKFPFAIFTIKT